VAFDCTCQAKAVHGDVVHGVSKTASKGAKNGSQCPGNERCEVISSLFWPGRRRFLAYYGSPSRPADCTFFVVIISHLYNEGFPLAKQACYIPIGACMSTGVDEGELERE